MHKSLKVIIIRNHILAKFTFTFSMRGRRTHNNTARVGAVRPPPRQGGMSTLRACSRSRASSLSKCHVFFSMLYIRAFCVCLQLEPDCKNLIPRLPGHKMLVNSLHFVSQVASLSVTVAGFAESEPERGISSESIKEEGQSAGFSEE